MPRVSAVARARSADREAIAVTWLNSDPFMDGITFLTAMSAQPITPQLTGSVTS